ncbi:MAG: heavy-metal-associated domain-containing protein [Bacteroidales bacterium]|nr:heavy-metal-associated domain-containing protein [Bacteroidales bacterium]
MKLTAILSALMLTTFTFSAIAAGNTAATTETSASMQNKKKAEIKEVVFNVGLHCENCVKKVTENISFEKGVKDLKVSLEDQTVTVKFDAAKTSEETLKAAIQKLGYPVSAKACCGDHHKDGKCTDGQCTDNKCKDGQCTDDKCKDGQCKDDHGHQHKH